VRGVQNEVASDFSETLDVTTLVNTSQKSATASKIKYSLQNDKLYIRGLSGAETISIYAVTGVCVA
jgi:hypothetical protein